MKVTETGIPEVLIIEPKVFGDERGYFFESFQRRTFEQATGLTPEFVQDNHSCSARGVLRGLHYQIGREAQAKLIRVTHGEVFDVAVDVRRGSPTFGRWVGARLSAKNHLQIWVPAGFAHGFLNLTDETEVLYKSTGFYDPANERVIRYDDPAIGIQWPFDGAPILSERDARAPLLAEAEAYATSEA